MGQGPSDAARRTDPAGALRGLARRWRRALHYHLADHAILRRRWTNMDEVAPGVWRSNQPTRARLRALRDAGFRTVLSLRGDGDRSFHDEARDGCRAAGLRLLTVALRSRRAPERAEVLRLFQAFREAERPLLIHCKSGADRSGFAAALYLVAHRGETVAEARRHLSWRYLHLRGGRAGVLGHILDLYEARLRQGPVGIEEWFATDYDADAAQAGFRR